MNRREFLARAGTAAAGLTLAGRARLTAGTADPRWREFEITTHVRVMETHGATRVWLPTPLAIAPYQHTMGDNYHPGSGTAAMIETNANEPDMLGCVWDEDVEASVTLVSRVAMIDYAVAIPDAVEVERARMIFDEVRDNITFARRCRETGLRARNVYGLRLISADATRSQHVRAELFLAGSGWVPVDAEQRRFGSWGADWVAYNFANSVRLRGSSREPLDYFMYPQGETAEGPVNSLDPEHFKYSIAVQEATAATPRPAN